MAKTHQKVLVSVDKITHLIHSEIPVIYQLVLSPFLGIYTLGKHVQISIRHTTKEVTAALFMTAPNCKHLEDLSPAAQIIKLQLIHIMQYCTATKMNDLPHAAALVKFTSMMLRKKNPRRLLSV